MELFGRKQIFSSAKEITADNVVNEVVEKAYISHLTNRSQIEYLYKYFKGNQPILYRQKDVRPEINNRVVENRANEIVNFKTSFLVGEPIQYVSRGGEDAVGSSVADLNGMMNSLCKQKLDHDLVEWQNICGTSYRLVLPSNDEYAPFDIFTLDPRNTFVIYSNDVSHRPLAGIWYVVDTTGNVQKFSVYTETMYFELENAKIVATGFNGIGRIPIIEYPANNARLGSFEVVLPLLDALNKLDSDRKNGIEQFVQSLLVVYNADFEDEITANKIREAGMIILNDTSDNKRADIKQIADQLDQVGTQTLKNDLYQTVLNIVGMPSQGDGTTSDSSNNGAVIMRNGWQQAEARAKDSELMFKMSENQFLKIVLRICRDLKPGFSLNLNDIDYRFTRRCYEDILSKSQVLTTMLANDKIDPQLAFNVCGLFTDSEEAYLQSMTWYEQHKEPTEEVVVNEPITI